MVGKQLLGSGCRLTTRSRERPAMKTTPGNGKRNKLEQIDKHTTSPLKRKRCRINKIVLWFILCIWLSTKIQETLWFLWFRNNAISSIFAFRKSHGHLNSKTMRSAASLLFGNSTVSLILWQCDQQGVPYNWCSVAYLIKVAAAWDQVKTDEGRLGGSDGTGIYKTMRFRVRSSIKPSMSRRWRRSTPRRAIANATSWANGAVASWAKLMSWRYAIRTNTGQHRLALSDAVSSSC